MAAACVGPYSYTCEGITGDGSVFIDYEKTKLVAVITPCNSPLQLPCIDAVLLKEEIKCPDGCDIRWYECPSIKGRIYTLLATGCEVYITSFENGLLNYLTCDASQYGSSSFCFGKIYDPRNGPTEAAICHTEFEFDDHWFSVDGAASNLSLFDCSDCSSQKTLTLMSTEPNVPPEATFVEIVETTAESQNVVTQEETTWFDDVTGGESGDGMTCLPEEHAAVHSLLGSHDNPCVATLPNGWAVVAYEERDDKGNNKISLATFKTTVSRNGFYYRKLSFGRLINDVDLNAYGAGTFEIYDDIVIDKDPFDRPLTAKYLGFLTGPLKGQSYYQINYITREINENGTVKHIVRFDIGDREPQFQNSNDANNVSYVIFEPALLQPALENLQILTLPAHRDSNGNQVPVANPSLAIPKNNLMLGGEEFVYLTYQAFENNTWNVYLKQIRFCEKDKSDPVYLSPYTFTGLNPTLTPVSSTNYANYTYEVSAIANNGITYCAIFDIYTSDNQRVMNCNPSVPYQPLCSLNSDSEYARLEYTLSISCAGGVPGWAVGTRLSYTDITDQFSGCNGVSPNPASSGWCTLYYDCNQYSLYDDPYCITPYIGLVYEPTDMYTLIDGDQIVSRVLYSMYLNSDDEKTVDIMFVVDSSMTMIPKLGELNRYLPVFEEYLATSGFSYRYGLTIFGKGVASGVVADPSPVLCSDDYIYNGIHGVGYASNGFTTRIGDIQTGMNVIASFADPGKTNAAVNFALTDSRFVWRSNAKRIIILISDSVDSDAACDSLSVSQGDTITNINTYDVAMSFIVDSVAQSTYQWMINAASPVVGLFNFGASYEKMLVTITENLNRLFLRTPVIEKDTPTYEATFLNLAQVLISYDGDLESEWVQNRSSFKFTDGIPERESANKNLGNIPYPIYSTELYGVDPVHLVGRTSNWVYFSAPGLFDYSYPNVGTPETDQADPVLIARNANRAVCEVNMRNELIIAYESHETSTAQIKIIGTGDFSQQSRLGTQPKRQTRFLEAGDFVFSHTLTNPSQGLNQLPDIVIDNNNVTHVVWQSNRDSYWEVYYANGTNLFAPVRLTKAESRSSFPSIGLDNSGRIYVTFHDDRYGHSEIFLAFKDEKRLVPLLEQDAYLASLRSGYLHSSDSLQLTVYNPGTLSDLPGALWSVKNASGTGNDNENYIFQLDPITGNIIQEEDISTLELSAIAGLRDGTFYGFSSTGAILRLAEPPSSSQIGMNVDDFVQIGQLSNVSATTNWLSWQKIADSTDLPDDDPATAYGTFQNLSFNYYSGSPYLAWTSSQRVFLYDGLAVTMVAKDGVSGILDPACAGITQNRVVFSGTSQLQIYDHNASTFTDIYARIYNYINQITSNDPDFYQGPTYLNPDIIFPVTDVSSYNNQYFISLSGKATYAGDQTIVKHYAMFLTESGNLRVEYLACENYNCSYIYHYDAAHDGRSFYSRLRGAPSNLGYIYEYILPNIATAGVGQSLNTVGLELATNTANGGVAYSVLPVNGRHSICVNRYTNGMALIDVNQLSYDLSYDGQIITYNTLTALKIASLSRYKSETLVQAGDTLLGKTVQSIDRVFSNRVLSNSTVATSISFTDASKGLFLATVSDVTKVLDASGDHANRLWVMTGTNEIGYYCIELKQLDLTNGSVLRSSARIEVSSTENVPNGAFAVTGTGDFYAVYNDMSGVATLWKSSYPAMTSNTATFSFNAIRQLLTINFKSLTIDENDNLYGLDIDNDLYLINKTTGDYTKIGDPDLLSEDNYVGYPIGTLAGIGYQFNLASTILGTDGYFNVMLQLYDNINLQGAPVAQIDTVNHPNAFASAREVLPGISGYYIPGQGVYLRSGESATLSFNACDPTVSILLVSNQTYFAKVFAVAPDGQMRLIQTSQQYSVSITNCNAAEAEDLFDSNAGWESSGQGRSDTRITDGHSNCLRAITELKSDETAIMMFEDHNSDEPRIKAATFLQPNKLNGTGSKSWYNYDLAMIGQDVDFTIDFFGRPVFVVEQPDQTSPSKTRLTTNSILYKACDFTNTSTATSASETLCSIHDLEQNVITNDPFMAEKIVKRVAIRPEYVKYFTYNIAQKATPVVSSCNLIVEIYGTPEVIAYRLRNENQTTYSKWCHWNPQIGNYMTEVEWKLSSGSGIKQICVQAMTYSGVTSEFCIPVIADYEKVIYDIKLYKKGTTAVLPQYNGLFVANTSLDSSGNASLNEEIDVEIYPNKYFGEARQPSVSFDVIQQGLNDVLNATATRSVNAEGREVYKGTFEIYRQDNKLNADGLARIRVRFPDACEHEGMTATSGSYAKDSYNTFSLPVSDSSVVTDDALASYRQSDTGKIGVPVLIRPSNEDPYLIFGDPNYYINSLESDQSGIIEKEQE